MLGLGETGALVPAVPDIPMLKRGSNDLGEDTLGVACAGGWGAPGDDGVVFMKPKADPAAGGAALIGCCRYGKISLQKMIHKHNNMTRHKT